MCSRPKLGRFVFGTVAVDCPMAAHNNIRFRNIRSQAVTVAVLVASVLVLALVVKLGLSASAPDVRHGAATWYCLQTLALAIRMGHVPWPPLIRSSLMLVSDTVLLNVRPLAQLLIGCDFIHLGFSPFYSQWGFGLAILGTALLFKAITICGRFLQGSIQLALDGPRRMKEILRLASPVFVLAACEALDCQQFPGSTARLRADPNVLCWEVGSLQYIAAGIGVLCLLISITLSICLGCRGGLPRFSWDFDLFALWLLAAAVVFLADQPTEVAVLVFLISTVRLLVKQVRPAFPAFLDLVVAAFALAALAVLHSRRSEYSGGQNLNSEEWAAAAIAVATFAIPGAKLALDVFNARLDYLNLQAEAQQSFETVSALKNFETISLVVLSSNGLSKGAAPHDANPRLVVTATTDTGVPLMRDGGRLNSRVMALDPMMQPAAAHCLTFGLPGALHDATFSVEVS
jgi:hypothetical protein